MKTFKEFLSEETPREAKVTLDTVDDENFDDFKDYLKTNNIKMKIVKQNGSGGWPEIEYTGTREALEKMIDIYWDDDDLKKGIE